MLQDITRTMRSITQPIAAIINIIIVEPLPDFWYLSSSSSLLDVQDDHDDGDQEDHDDGDQEDHDDGDQEDQCL